MTMQTYKSKVTDRDILMSVLGCVPNLIHLRKKNLYLKYFSLNKIQHS